MSGHDIFSQLTEHFSEDRQAAIAEKTAQLKKETGYHQSKSRRLSKE
jgi:hypothetical protein